MAPMDAPLAPMDAPAAAAEEPAAEEDEYKPLTIMNWLDGTNLGDRLKCRKIRLSGNLVQSVTLNPQSPKDRFNGPVTWTDRSNEYQMNQWWMTAEKATDTSERDWDLGGRIDTLYGTSYRFTTEAGLEDKWNIGRQFYGLALPQAYTEVAYKKLKVKVGHFISPVGYFTVDTTQNFFNTIPYTYQYGEPFTHTGALATYKANDKWTVGGGVTRGWDAFNRANYGPPGTFTYASPNLGWLGTATYTGSNGGSIAYVNVWSNEATQTANTFSSRYYQTFVVSRPIIKDKLNYVFQSDFGHQDNAIAATGKGANWYGVNQYLFLTQNECITWGINFEWFRDEEGYRVGGFLPSLPASTARGLSPARSGYAGNFYQVTMGPKWTPYQNKNLVIRPNARFDWFQGEILTNNLNPTGLKPYNNGDSNGQFIFGTDIYYLF